MFEIKDLAQTAAGSLGLLTSSDLASAGVTRKRRYRLERDGVLRGVQPGVFALVGAPQTWEQSVFAACLAGGPGVAASHRSACRLLDLRSRDPEVEIVVRVPRDPRFDGVLVHRSRDLAESDIVQVGVVPVTSPVRTICDAGLVFPAHEVARMARHAVATGMVTAADLQAFRCRVGRRGRTGVIALDAALESMPHSTDLLESGPELALCNLLEVGDLPQPIRQFELIALGHHYRFDLAYPGAQLAIEYDGFAAHSSRAQFTADRQRQNEVVASGWTILRFTHRDLMDHPAKIVQMVRQALAGSVL